ncbi:MAG: hypothetical protein LQ343_002383 [Gyalolechia ehrenbergii]|nr:MAG: hypothetical protein LQ343_002383 [Gyalolechia ehrenbergii]
MATKRLSPTASLLKNSRLFSLPPPLPRATHDFTATSTSDSDTATLPYPTHAAIETTQTSLSRGDWGLKRPLPLKSTTNTSTPTIRIDDVDSIDHITDFESASDHTLTLRKWQEIGLPISMPVKQKGPFVTSGDLNTRRTPPTSVFEGAFDNTESRGSESDTQRWKFKGPWLAGKTEGEFTEYLEKSVKRRKLEFRSFIRGCLQKARAFDQRRKAQESGEAVESPVEVSEEDVDLYFKQLRRGDGVRLHMLVEEFLDLPIAADSKVSEGTVAVMMDSDRGPPSTHLSAGLSYLRTGSHMTNHPILGPMEEEPPVQARILRPQVSGFVPHGSALLGIGGIAAEDTTKRTSFKQRERGTSEKPGIQRFDPEIKGGAKIWIQPDRATVNVRGRLKLHVLRVGRQDEAIYEGVVDEADVRRYRPPSNPGFRTMPKLDLKRAPKVAKSSDYGLGGDRPDQSPWRAAPLNTPKGSTDSIPSLLNVLDAGLNR